MPQVGFLTFGRQKPKPADTTAREARAMRPKAARRSAVASFLQDPRLHALLQGRELMLVDVGAKAGIQPEWKPLLPVLEVIGFDPNWPEDIGEIAGDVYDVGEVRPARKKKRGLYPAKTTFLPIALADRSGFRAFHMTRGPSMSSFLRPNFERTTLYGLGDDSEILRTIEIETTTLDEVVEERQLAFVDFVKLDTQGSELDVLRGGERTIRDLAFGLRVETCLSPLYESQPLFTDIDPYLREQGFELMDILHRQSFARLDHETASRMTRAHRKAGTAAPKPPGGQLVVMDPIYLKSPAGVTVRLEGRAADDRQRYVAGAVMVCLVYGFVDYALELLALVEPLVDSEFTRDVRAAISLFPVPK